MDKNKILSAIGDFSNKKVLVIGDVILDAYHRGEVNRISPEAPVPVLELKSREYRLGGAANVAVNIHQLGAACILCTVTGHDDPGDQIKELMLREGLSTDGVVRSKGRKTSIKTRIISGHNQLLRVDEEQTHDLDKDDEILLIDRITELVVTHQPEAIVFEDYDKGVITPQIIRRTMELAKSRNIRVSVDPKRKNFFSYGGATLFKPNLKELRDGLNLPEMGTTDEELKIAFEQLNGRMPVDVGFFTLSAEGVFITDGRTSHRLPAFKRNIADVSGAGDTVIATATCALISGMNIEEIAWVSNLAAGWVCRFPGVVSITDKDLIDEVENLH